MTIHKNVCTNSLCVQRKVRAFWKQRMEGCEIQFSNRPFTVLAIWKLDCLCGNHYYKEHQAKSNRT